MNTLAVQTDERVQDVQISDDYLVVALMDVRGLPAPRKNNADF